MQGLRYLASDLLTASEREIWVRAEGKVGIGYAGLWVRYGYGYGVLGVLGRRGLRHPGFLELCWAGTRAREVAKRDRGTQRYELRGLRL